MTRSQVSGPGDGRCSRPVLNLASPGFAVARADRASSAAIKQAIFRPKVEV